MKRDFSFDVYEQFLITAIQNDYELISYEKYLKDPDFYKKVIILRHDVDKKPNNALIIADIEKDLGVTATYYFRIVKKSFNESIIKSIASKGHEIGYHYEDLALAKGDYNKAIRSFEENLRIFREFYPVCTVCMHGSPLSRWDNKKIWERYSYRKYGIKAEPLLDLDFNEIFYLTDTGMEWNASHVSVRDKVKSPFKFVFDTTFDIIDTLQKKKLPDIMMVNTHPQRWSNVFLERTYEYFLQSLKNLIKKQIVQKSK